MFLQINLVVNAYPFGMTLPGRTHSSTAYRYGFNGMEKDDELKGEGNSLNYTFRMHDPRVGRFFAVDPLFKSYPYNSTYAFAENKVVEYVELEGLEVGFSQVLSYAKAGLFGKSVQQVTNGVDKSLDKTVKGLQFIAENPKQALEGAGNILLTVSIKGSGAPSVIADATLQNIDMKFGTTTHATNQTFQESISVSADKLVNGDLEDKSEVVTDIVTILYGDKAISKAFKFIPKPGVHTFGVSRAGFVNLNNALKWLDKYLPNDSKIINGCEKVAQKINKEIGGMYLEMTNKINKNYTLGPINKIEDTHIWYHHVAAIKDGMVFDHLTGKAGMYLDDYMKMFDYAEDLEFKIVETITVK